MRHVSRTHRVALDWACSIESILDPKIQIKYIDTKNQLADILTKGSFTRDEWNHLLTLFNISHFSSTACIASIAKRAPQDSGDERVTAKSRPMMIFDRWERHRSCRLQLQWARGRDITEFKILWSPLLEKVDKGNLVREQSFSPTDYSKLDYDHVWSSQEWKAEATTHDRSRQPDKTSWRMVQQVRPDHEATLLDGTAQSVRYGEPLRDRSGQPDDINSQEAANSQNFNIGRDTTKLELSVESRSFVNQVNDQVRKRQKRISNVAEGEEHSIIWRMFML